MRYCRHSRVRAAIAALAVLTLGQGASAAEILSINVDANDGIYTMNSKVWFDANIDQIYEVYRSWNYSEKFSSTIVEAHDLEPDELGRARFYIRNRGCVLFFCQSFERQGYVETEPKVVLRAFANPDASDFLLSNESWTFDERDGGTVVTYAMAMKPKFWIPPGIGPYLIKRKLRNNGGDAVDRIELIAQGIASE